METNGKIRIRPRFDNSDAKKGAEELEKMLERVKKKTMDSFASNPDKGFASIAKSAQRELSKVDSALEKAQIKLQEYQNKLDEIDAKKDVELNKIRNSSEVKSTWAFKGDSKADALVEKKMTESKAVQKLNDEYDKTLEKAEMMKEKIAALNQKHDETLIKFSEEKKAIEEASDKIDESKSKVSDLKRKVDDTASSIKKAKSNQDNFTSSISKGIKKMAKMALAVFSIRSAYSLVRQAVNNVISANDELSGKIEGCKNMLGAVFEPMIATIVNGIVKAISYLGTFISMLTGINLIAKANAKALDKQAGSASKATKSLLAIDEINNLSENSGSGSGSSTAFLEEADGMKAKFEELLEPIRNAWDKYGQEFIDKFKYGLSEVQGLIGAIGSSFNEVWLNGTGEATASLILVIMTDIFETVGNIAGKLKEAWNEGGKGTAIIQSLWNILNNVLLAVQKITAFFSKWSKSVNFNPLFAGLQELIESFERITEDIAPGIEWFMNEILTPLASFVIEDTVPAFFNLLAGALDLLNSVCDVFRPLGQWLWQEFLMPIGLWTGGVVVDIINGISDAFRKISDWISENQTLLETLVIIFGSLYVASQLVYGGLNLIHTVAILLNSGLAVLKGETTALGTAFALLKSPIGLVVLAIGAVIAIAVLLIKHWDEVKEAAVKCWNWIVETWQGASEWFQKNILDPIKGAFESFVNFLIGGFEGFINFAIRGINAIIDALNSIHFDIPDWVPVIGGKSYGINIGRLSEISLPRVALAQGGIVNRPTRALVGEAGAEAVFPLQNSSFIDDFADKISSKIGLSGNVDLDGVIQLLLDIADILIQILNKDNDIVIDGDSLAEVMQKKIDDRQKRIGTKALALDR